MNVACMTNDFAMQNVLLQMNMNLVSTGGHRITKIKNWVLRCHGCFSVTSDMERKFCPKCGGATLTRVSCSTNSNGTVRYHLKHGHSYNLRGTVFSMPNPKGGRVHNNIVLREDQREYVKAKETQSKKKLVDISIQTLFPSTAAKQANAISTTTCLAQTSSAPADATPINRASAQERSNSPPSFNFFVIFLFVAYHASIPSLNTKIKPLIPTNAVVPALFS
ncbi:Nin one binding Zn-ribbon like-domain-containing protein [Gongronella butleri]|nr:Nin one binding Zn-ribbon like-domain-containing protein [Gongronella butleri]